MSNKNLTETNILKAQPLVTILTVNYNQSAVTLDLLESLRDISYKNIEVIVVDNGSPTDFPEIIKTKYPEVNLIKSRENLGFAGGNNLGLKYAKGEYVFFVNNDVEVPTGFLEPLLSEFDKDNRVAMVSPKIRYYHTPDKIQYAGSTQMNPYTIRNSHIGWNEVDKGQYDKVYETNYAHGAAMLVKKSVIDEVGSMAEVFFLYYEELDWCERIKNAGYKIVFNGNSEILHKESVSTGKMSPLKMYYLTRNRLLFARRNIKGFKLLLSMLFFAIISIPKNTLTLLLKGQTELLASFYKGVLWNLKN